MAQFGGTPLTPRGQGYRRPTATSLLSYDAFGRQIEVPVGLPGGSGRFAQQQEHPNQDVAEVQHQVSTGRRSTGAPSVAGSRRSVASSATRRRQAELTNQAEALTARQAKNKEIRQLEAEIAELEVRRDVSTSAPEKIVISGQIKLAEIRLRNVQHERDEEQKEIAEKGELQQQQIDLDEEEENDEDDFEVDEDAVEANNKEQSGTEKVDEWLPQVQSQAPPHSPQAHCFNTVPQPFQAQSSTSAPPQFQAHCFYSAPPPPVSAATENASQMPQLPKVPSPPPQVRVEKTTQHSPHVQFVPLPPPPPPLQGPPARVPRTTSQVQQPRVQPTAQQAPPQGAMAARAVGMADLVDAIRYLKTEDNRSYMSGTDRDLPRFGGEPDQWVQFSTEFDRTTAKYKLDDSDNIIRLRKALVGNAKSTVQHLMANVANVPVIIQILEKRFGKPRVVLNALAEKAKSCPPVTIYKPATIIEFGIAVQALYANVVSFGEDGYLNSVELLDSLVRKLSPDLATKWFEWLTNNSKKDNLTEFASWISTQMDIAYQREEFKPSVPEERPDKNRRRGPGKVNVAAGEKCICCGESCPELSKCQKFTKMKVQDRWDAVKQNKLCIACLSSGHVSKDCPKRQPCPSPGCTRSHHKLLHTKGKRPIQNAEPNPPPAAPRQVPEPVEENLEERTQLVGGRIGIVRGCDGPLPIVPVKVRGPTGIVARCHVMLDSGASRTLITKKLADKLQLSGPEMSYSYSGITGGLVTEKSMRVDCDISGLLRHSKYHSLTGGMVLEEIRMPPYSFNVDEAKKRWPHLKGVAASNLTNVTPDIIVGNNNPHLILARKFLTAGDLDPIGWRSLLGWTISGNFDGFQTGSINFCGGRSYISNDELHHMIKSSFSLEDFGVKLPQATGRNLDDKRAYQIMEKTTRKVGDKWETGLLWRQDDVSFPETESAALRRLLHTEQKMKNPAFAKMYRDKFAELLSKGYIRKMTKEEVAAKTGKRFVIPHFGVTNPNNPGKFRLVMDAKAKVNGVSLNDELLSGPALILPLTGIVWNFRRHRIGLVGDITDMFPRVGIIEEDRDAPLKKTKMPRLGLQAALMGARLAVAFEEETKLKFTVRFFWSDSTTVLTWLNSRAGKLPEFVANRIGEIQEITDRAEWHWISTKINIADIATRFECDISFDPDSVWFQGPDFLRGEPASLNFGKEQKGDGCVYVLASADINPEKKGQLLEIRQLIPDPRRFSRYHRLLRATAGAWKALWYWRRKAKKNTTAVAPWTELAPVKDKKGKVHRQFSSKLEPADLQMGEYLLFRSAQEDAYRQDLESALKTGKLDKRGKLWKLKPLLGEDKLFRIDGRIGKANAPATQKFPVILPTRHRITDLVVYESHVEHAHQGLDTVKNDLRKKVWVVDSGHVVRRIFSECPTCRIRKAEPVPAKMAALPACRLASFQPPFTHTGVDLFGPIEVTVGRHREKRWGVLFCCMTVRAVHLEIVNGLSTDEFLMALSRFVDIRRRPEAIYSDNGTNLVGAAREIREMWQKVDVETIQQHAKFQEIAWNFNPPGAPHMGGAWERLIQSVKRCLKSVLWEKHPKDKTLETLFKSVENILNSRPLTSVSCDPADDEAITPNHLLKGLCDDGPALPADIDEEQIIREQWKRAHVMADRFWQRWTRAYLPKLLQRGKWKECVDPIKEGAIVFLVDESLPRNCWKKGYISKIYPCEDGQVREVDVTTRQFMLKTVKIYNRAVTKIVPIGVEMGN